jgi:acetylornithine aminotransferase
MISFYSNSVVNKLQVELAEKLGNFGLRRLLPIFNKLGAESNEMPLNSFFSHRTKKGVAFNSAFHGRTSAAVRVTDNPKIVAPINEGIDVSFVALNDIDTVKTLLETKNIAP